MKAYWWLAVCFIVVISVHGCKWGRRHTGGQINEELESASGGGSGGGSIISGHNGYSKPYSRLGSQEQVIAPQATQGTSHGAQKGSIAGHPHGTADGTGGGPHSQLPPKHLEGNQGAGVGIHQGSNAGDAHVLKPDHGVQLNPPGKHQSDRPKDPVESISLETVIKPHISNPFDVHVHVHQSTADTGVHNSQPTKAGHGDSKDDATHESAVKDPADGEQGKGKSKGSQKEEEQGEDESGLGESENGGSDNGEPGKDETGDDESDTAVKAEDKPKIKFSLLTKIYHLAVLGGGYQIVALLGQFRRYKIRLFKGKERKLGDENLFNILVLEKNAIIGPGFAYDSTRVNKAHVTNTLQPLIDAATTAETDESDFEKWLKENNDNSLLEGDDVFIKRPQRYKVGQYLASRYVTFKNECIDLGYGVDEQTNAEATDVHKDGSGYIVKLKNWDGEIQAKNIFLATGHWDTSRLKDPIRNYHDSPWVKNLLEMLELKKYQQHIGTLGTSLSSIDLALLVSEYCGEFFEQQDEVEGGDEADRKVNIWVSYKYKTEQNGNQICKPFKITMYSRSGQLPQVRGYIPRLHQTEHVTESEILKITQEEGNDGFLPVQRLFDIITHQLDIAEGKETEDFETTITKKPGYQVNMNITDWLDFVFKVLYKNKVLTGEQMLRKDIKRAEKTIYIKPRKAITLQTVLYYSLLFLNLYGKYFSVEDIDFYKANIESKVYKLALTIPLQNARKMQALIKADMLQFKILGKTCPINERADNVPGVDVKYKHSPTATEEHTIEHNHFVDCRGQTGDIHLDKSELTQNMLKSGLIQPLYIRYKNQTEGKKYAEEEQGELCRVEEDIRLYADVKFEDGYYMRKVAGIVLDLNTFQALPADRNYVIDDDKNGAIYASGPYVYGYYYIAQSLYINVYISEVAVPDMLLRYGLIDKKMIEEVRTEDIERSSGVVFR